MAYERGRDAGGGIYRGGISMPVLSDRDIEDALATKDLIIEPIPSSKAIGPASIDLHLHPTVRVARSGSEVTSPSQGHIINVNELPNILETIDSLTEERRLETDQPFIMRPDSFVLGVTAEKVELSESLAASIEGKSSLARFGIAVHLTAPKIDPGWELNHITLELSNFGPFDVGLFPGMPIATLIVQRLSSPATFGYEGRFSSAHPRG